MRYLMDFDLSGRKKSFKKYATLRYYKNIIFRKGNLYVVPIGLIIMIS